MYIERREYVGKKLFAVKSSGRKFPCFVSAASKWPQMISSTTFNKTNTKTKTKTKTNTNAQKKER